MALLNILEFPDPRLRTKAVPVQTINDELRQLVNDMLETMYNASGVGLAATQINVHQRLLVIDISESQDDPRVFINPEILSRDGVEVREEGCLSVPGFFEEVQRADRIRVRAQDQHGQSFELDTDGLLAVCIQHEMDHLEGKLFVDYLTDLKRTRIRKKLEKEHKDRGDQPRYPQKSSVPAI
jgi:peptide deformylase